MPVQAGFSEGPCTQCQLKVTCTVYPDLRENLLGKANWRAAMQLDAEAQAVEQMTRAWLNSLAVLYKDTNWRVAHPPGVALAALFDYATSAYYAAEMVDQNGNLRLEGVHCEGAVHYPYVWTCPSCVARSNSHAEASNAYLPGAKLRDGKLYPDEDRLGKPGGRFIGDVGIVVISVVLREVLARLRPSMTLKRVGGKAGEFDLVLDDPEMLVMAEVKAKPMLCYPLVVVPSASLKAERHAWVRVPTIQIGRIGLNLAATGTVLPVSKPSVSGWPFKDMLALAQKPEAVKVVVENWHAHLDGYRLWAGEAPKLKWLRFGSGNFARSLDPNSYERRVSNTKILPGLDRTDDLKKGSSQVLGYAPYKLGCERHALKSALIGNTYAETHHATLEKNFSLKVASAAPGANPNRWEYVVDASIGFTQNKFYDAIMRFIDPENLFPLRAPAPSRAA